MNLPRPLRWLGAILLLTVGLGCNLTVPFLSPTPEIVPTVPPTPAMEMLPLEFPVGGFDLAYPADWVVSEQDGAIVLASSQDVADMMDWTTGALIIVLSGLPENVFADAAEEERTAEALLNQSLEGFRAQDDAQVGETEVRRFAHQEGVGVPIGWTEYGIPLRGYLATYADAEVVVLILAAAPEEQWETAWPKMESILSSAVFYAPTEATPEKRGNLERDVPVKATLKIAGVDEWTYCSEGDEYVTIDVVARGDWDPVLDVLNEDGETVASDDDSGGDYNPRLFGLHLEAPGCYALRVSAYSGYGDYEIAVRTGEAPGGGSLTYGDTVSSNLALGERETWTFEAQAGDAVRISMVGSGGLTDTYLELLDPDGLYLTGDDDSGEGNFALIAGYMLPVTGTYRISALSYASQSGPYTLTLEKVPVTVQSIAYGQTLTGTLTADAPYGYWTFEGTEGDRVTISMVGIRAMDTYLELYGPDGLYLIGDDDSGAEGSALILDYVLPATGVYRIAGRSLDETGPYTLSLTRGSPSGP